MTLTIDFAIAIIVAIAMLVGFAFSFRGEDRNVVPQKKRGGCLIFVLSALAVLLAIIYGITHNAVAGWYSDFYSAVAVILILFGLHRSGKLS